MKSKIAFLLAAAVLAISSSAAALDIDSSKLTANQIAELKIQALKMQQSVDSGGSGAIETAAKVSSTARTEAEKWGDFGKNIGVAMVSTAKEMGIAIEAFSKTDLGRITTAIIVYKLVGTSILKFFVGLILMFGLPTLIIAARNHMIVDKITYEYQDRQFLNLKWKKRVVSSVQNIEDSDWHFWIFFWTCILTIASIGLSLFVMF